MPVYSAGSWRASRRSSLYVLHIDGHEGSGPGYTMKSTSAQMTPDKISVWYSTVAWQYINQRYVRIRGCMQIHHVQSIFISYGKISSIITNVCKFCSRKIWVLVVSHIPYNNDKNKMVSLTLSVISIFWQNISWPDILQNYSKVCVCRVKIKSN